MHSEARVLLASWAGPRGVGAGRAKRGWSRTGQEGEWAGCRRCLKMGETGSSRSARMSSGTSSIDWLNAMGSKARRPGTE